MAGGTVSTTTPGMLQAASYFEGTQSVASGGIKTVSGELASLKSTWTGDASGAFDSSMQKWFEDCNVIINKLGEMVELMHGNRKIITEGESNNAHVAGAIPVGPGLGI